MPDGFMVLAGSDRSQAATMVLQSHEQASGPENQNAESDQWMLVLSGTGHAIVNGEEVRLRPGLMLLIEAGETHELRSDSAVALRTVNIYSPPAF
jgi:mannose-6-phosphate isomerase-like protein (cupin superfamily)